MATLTNPLIARYREKLAALPASGGGGCHPALLGVATVGVRCGIPIPDIFRDLRERVHGARVVPDREIAEAVNKAMQGRTGVQRRDSRPQWRPPRPAVTATPFGAAEFVAARVAEGDGRGEADIWEASPIRIEAEPAADAATLLGALYGPEDVLFTGDTYGRTVKTVAGWLAAFGAGRPLPPHIIPNPVSGALGMTKDGRPSYRADTCVKSFRFAVAEFDGMSREDQLRFWWAVDLPVCALIDSGGKSLHAWIRIDAVRTAAEWDAQVEGLLFARWLIPMGCDPACRNEARLSRLPGHYRAEKGRWQRLLYLAPEGRPIHAGA